MAVGLEGFEDLVGDVGLGEVNAVESLEVGGAEVVHYTLLIDLCAFLKNQLSKAVAVPGFRQRVEGQRVDTCVADV